MEAPFGGLIVEHVEIDVLEDDCAVRWVDDVAVQDAEVCSLRVE